MVEFSHSFLSFLFFFSPGVIAARSAASVQRMTVFHGYTKMLDSFVLLAYEITMYVSSRDWGKEQRH